MPMRTVCTPCGVPLEEGQQAIFAIEHEGQLVFGWTCCHRTVGDVAVVLASADCADKWLDEHPEHREAVNRLLSSLGHEHAVAP
jgi:hypothetical protein